MALERYTAIKKMKGLEQLLDGNFETKEKGGIDEESPTEIIQNYLKEDKTTSLFTPMDEIAGRTAIGFINAFFKLTEEALRTRDRNGEVDEFTQTMSAVDKGSDTFTLVPTEGMLKKHTKCLQISQMGQEVQTETQLKTYTRKFLNLRELKPALEKENAGHLLNPEIIKHMANFFYWTYLEYFDYVAVELTKTQINILLEHYQEDKEKLGLSLYLPGDLRSINSLVTILDHYGLNNADGEFILMDNGELDPEEKNIQQTKVLLLNKTAHENLNKVIQDKQVITINKNLILYLESAIQDFPYIQNADKRFIELMKKLKIPFELNNDKRGPYNDYDGYHVVLSRDARLALNKIIKDKLHSLAIAIGASYFGNYFQEILKRISEFDIYNPCALGNIYNYVMGMQYDLIQEIKSNENKPTELHLWKHRLKVTLDLENFMFETFINNIKEFSSKSRLQIISEPTAAFIYSWVSEDKTFDQKKLEDAKTSQDELNILLRHLGLEKVDTQKNFFDEKNGYAITLSLADSIKLNDKLISYINAKLPQDSYINYSHSQSIKNSLIDLGKAIKLFDFGNEKSIDKIITALNALYDKTNNQAFKNLAIEFNQNFLGKVSLSEELDEPLIILP